jgi:hypothetical protein
MCICFLCSHPSFSLLSNSICASSLDIHRLLVLGYLEPLEWKFDRSPLAALCLHLLPLPDDHFTHFGHLDLAYHLSGLQDLTHLVLQVLPATLKGL